MCTVPLCCIYAAPFLLYEFSVQPETRVGKGNFSIPRSFETAEYGRSVPHLSHILLTSHIFLQYLLLQGI